LHIAVSGLSGAAFFVPAHSGARAASSTVPTKAPQVNLPIFASLCDFIEALSANDGQLCYCGTLVEAQIYLNGLLDRHRRTSMSANLRPPSAKIYQFPGKTSVRAAAAAREERLARDLRLRTVPSVEFGSGWYHDAAIQAEKVRKP